MALPEWLRIFLDDIKVKEFIPLKILFFLTFGASMALFPFLTIHARSLGVSEQELGIIYAFNPIIALGGPPLTGLLADRLGNFKILLSILMCLSGLAGLLFAVVPAARFVQPLPELLPYTLTCNPSDRESMVAISIDKPYSCDYIDRQWSNFATITNCSLCEKGWHNNADSQLSLTLKHSTDNSSLLQSPSKLYINNWECPKHTSDIMSEQQNISECHLECQVMVQSSGLCTNEKITIEKDSTATFYTFLVVRLVNGLTLATSFTMLDGATIAILREHGGDFGLQRLYANLGAVVFAPLTGYLIDAYSPEKEQPNFLPSFIAYCILKLTAAVVILFANLDFRKQNEKVLKDFKYLITQPEIIAFLVVMFLSGTLYGYLDTFLFWLLEDLGAGKSLMGITVTVGSLSGVPILICSHYIINGIGYANTIILGFAFYAFRMLGYSFISNPWWAMPFEFFECFTNSLLSTAAASYAGDMATPTTIATLQGMYGGLHHGVGRGAGGLIGGMLASILEIHVIFRIMALACVIICIVYFILNYLFFQKLQNERKQIKEDKIKADEIAEKESKESVDNGLNMNHIDTKNSALDNPAFTMEVEKNDSVKNGFIVKSNGTSNKVEESSS